MTGSVLSILKKLVPLSQVLKQDAGVFEKVFGRKLAFTAG